MCGDSSLIKVMSLTPTPPGNDFLTKEELGREPKVEPVSKYVDQKKSKKMSLKQKKILIY